MSVPGIQQSRYTWTTTETERYQYHSPLKVVDILVIKTIACGISRSKIMLGGFCLDSAVAVLFRIVHQEKKKHGIARPILMACYIPMRGNFTEVGSLKRDAYLKDQ